MAFEELKRRQSVVWGAAPFEDVAADIAGIHEHLVRELEPRTGEAWLDVGTGTGGVAVLAARAGARVSGSDLAPALVETARRLAAEEGLAISYAVGDAEALPYPDSSFDVVSSGFGAIFAPDHAAVARELARVCRPGGRLGLSAWNPAGDFASFFKLLGSYQPPPPEGAGNPLEWGREEHARELLGDDFELRFVHDRNYQEGETPEQVWQLFVTSFGPLKVLYESLDEGRRSDLQRDYIAFFEKRSENGRVHAPRDYLLILGTRRPGS